jgi:uncharacterized protein (TIGR02145 family)
MLFISFCLSCTPPPLLFGPSIEISNTTVTDIDGNVYQTVKIGNQIWTTENLRVTKYNDGSEIPNITDNIAWEACSSSTAPAYCYYNNTTNTDSIKKFGALYNWYAVSPANLKKIAPAGWHVPSYAEWVTLMNYLIANGYNWDGTTRGNKIAKSMASQTGGCKPSSKTKNGVIENDSTKNNRSGFSALPGGNRRVGHGFFGQSIIEFSFLGAIGSWWCAGDDAYYGVRNGFLICGDAGFYLNYSSKSNGCSVRLVRD